MCVCVCVCVGARARRADIRGHNKTVVNDVERLEDHRALQGLCVFVLLLLLLWHVDLVFV